MKIGIIGAGNIGGTLTRRLARSDSRPDRRACYRPSC